MQHILIADDDIELCSLLADYLQAENFQVQVVHDGESALNEVMQQHYDILVLDIMMPRMNGLEVLRELQHNSSIPVLMLTARGDDVDRIIGLEMGADDYLAKPCNPRELVARLRAILRRSQQKQVQEQTVTRIGDLSISHSERSVSCAQQLISLTSTEFNVLACLLEQAGKVVSKEALTRQALARNLTAYDRSIDMHISNIRKKLGPHADGLERIKTIRGLGYIYTVNCTDNIAQV